MGEEEERKGLGKHDSIKTTSDKHPEVVDDFDVLSDLGSPENPINGQVTS